MLPILATLAEAFYLAGEGAQTSSKANQKCCRAQGPGSSPQPRRGRRLWGQDTASWPPSWGSSALSGLNTSSSMAGSLSYLTSSFHRRMGPGIASVKTTCSQIHVLGFASGDIQTKTPGKEEMISKSRLEKKDWLLAACPCNTSITLVMGV